MTRTKKSELEIGTVVADRYGREVVVTRLAPFEDNNAPQIRDNEFGYIPVDSNLSTDHVAGVSSVNNISHVVSVNKNE